MMRRHGRAWYKRQLAAVDVLLAEVVSLRAKIQRHPHAPAPMLEGLAWREQALAALLRTGRLSVDEAARVRAIVADG